jgi:guanylate kinase
MSSLCSIKAVENVTHQGKICILDIDVQGVQNVKKSTLDAVYIFICPPSMEELEKRLRGRGTETEEAIQKRLENAKTELDYGMVDDNFDRVFTNDDLDETFETMVEELKDWYPQLS